MIEEKLPAKWKLKRQLNTLSLNYDVLKRENEDKDRVITRLKNENKKLKEEKKQWLKQRKKHKKK